MRTARAAHTVYLHSRVTLCQPMKRVDDFPETTKQALAQRVAYRCSRASCRRPTVGPHSEPDKATRIGEAAHICAASEGGPRFEPSMIPEERRSPENGIWLCANCATEIDKDPQRFPVSLLRQWKIEAEQEAERLLENPSYRQLGVPRPAFAPPIAYQRSALVAVLEHLRRSGVGAGQLPPLAHVRANQAVRAGSKPHFGRLTLRAGSVALRGVRR